MGSNGFMIGPGIKEIWANKVGTPTVGHPVVRFEIEGSVKIKWRSVNIHSAPAALRDVEEMTTRIAKIFQVRERQEGCRIAPTAQAGHRHGTRSTRGLGPRGCRDTSTSRRRTLKRRRRCAKRQDNFYYVTCKETSNFYSTPVGLCIRHCWDA